MHLKMSTMTESKVSKLDNNENFKSSPNHEPSSRYLQRESNGNDLNSTYNTSDSGDEDIIGSDGRHSSTTYVIQMDNKCDDLVDIDAIERERLAHENCDVGDEEDEDDRFSDNDQELDCYTSHIPLNSEIEVSGESPYSNEHFGAPVPTPIELGIKDILNDENEHGKNIKQKKYHVLPSIGKTSNFEDQRSQEELSDEDPNINQLDFTRERMETEADFFADYRVNTSVVKATPRNVPLPPIGQTFSPRSQNSAE